MLKFSRDPKLAERQMHAIIFYLTTFGYIDGDFDISEKAFVRDYIRKLVRQRVHTGMPEADDKLKGELEQKFTKHFHEVFQGIDHRVRELFTEAVAQDEDHDQFVHAKLKLRCFEIFQSFDEDNQQRLMETVDELIQADGLVHPAEAKLRAELSHMLHENLDIDIVVEDDVGRPSIEVVPPVERPVPAGTHPFFDRFEFHYSSDPERISKQVAADRNLITRVIELIAAQQAAGEGILSGHEKVSDFAGHEPFLDGHIYVVPPKPGRRYELTVLGDLHGCYSNLKAAVLQSGFFEKVAAFRKDPENNPDPKLVLLGDYIDRGLFSLNGVLRSVLQLFVSAPEHVYVLRGNHEYYFEYEGQVYGGVKPAEAINTLKPHLPADVFKHYMALFDAMPNVLFFDGAMFVHGGIPRDLLIKERYQDLSSLNDADMRFQMMWSDPSSADVIPAELQEQSARFPFGKLQAAAFLHRMGCHTLVRGHEKIEEGFRKHYDDEQLVLMTVFSAGGVGNEDLPSDSSYGNVVPHALTMTFEDNELVATPWPIEFEQYNDPEHNAFFKARPEIEYRK